MGKGIIYCMTTIVPGLVKIGKTGSDNFDGRMYHLEHNGYSNVVGLQRHFAIEVEDYDDKEKLIDDIFSKSRVGNTELFSLDVNLVVQLLASLEGKQVFPVDKSKDDVFGEATESRGISCVPDGIYCLTFKPMAGVTYKAFLKKENGNLILRKDSRINAEVNKINIRSWRELRASDSIKDGIVVKDIMCDSLSMAATLVKGRHTNGWLAWKTDDGKSVDIYRAKKEDTED